MRPIAIIAALALLHIVLAMPADAGALGRDAWLRVPFELPAILLLLLVPPPAWRLRACAPLAAAIGASVALKLADAAARASLGRPFDPFLDLHLVAAGWDLLQGAVGPVRALMAAAAVGAVLAATVALGWAALRVLASALPRPDGFVRRAGWPAALGAGTLSLAFVPGLPGAPAPEASAVRLVYAKAADAVVGARTTRALLREARDDAFATVDDEHLLVRLAGRDVLIVFVESYGRSAVEDPRYAAAALPALDALDEAAAARGLEVRSGWLTAPMAGGQSWLAHGSVLAGLWIDTQRRYDGLVAAEARSLVRDFRRAGWRTVAVMPAITAPWPEGTRFGWERIYGADDLGYRGAPFNWITMPDQFTLAALERLELGRIDRPPVMAILALISSHAPWTPVPPVLPWPDIGDGSVFTPHAEAGDPPEVVWRDRERVRRQYATAVAYTLRTLAAYVETYGRDDLVIVALGDHQPAPLITGEGASRDVPVHIVGDAAVADAIAGWGWTSGARPGDAPVWRMDAFREHFLTAFTPPVAAVSRLTGSERPPVLPN